MGTLVTLLILVVSLINLLPTLGVTSVERLQSAYGVTIAGPDLEILMRHRAALFGVVGGLLAAAAFHAPLRPAAYAAGFFNMLGFMLIAWLVAGANPEIRRVALVDLVGALLLLAALVIERCSGVARSGA